MVSAEVVMFTISMLLYSWLVRSICRIMAVAAGTGATSTEKEASACEWSAMFSAATVTLKEVGYHKSPWMVPVVASRERGGGSDVLWREKCEKPEERGTM